MEAADMAQAQSTNRGVGKFTRDRAKAESKGQETRRILLEAAEGILIEQGIQALTVRRIGAVSELAPTLVTYHFGTITSLLSELCRRNLEPMLAAWEPLGETQFRRLRDLLEAWLHPLLFPAAFVPGGRALIVLDEIAAHGDAEFRQMLLTPMLELSQKLQVALGPFTPHLDPRALRARVRFLSAATLGPPPRSHGSTAQQGSPPIDDIEYLLDFATAALQH